MPLKLKQGLTPHLVVVWNYDDDHRRGCEGCGARDDF
jgi:hypothetical protein